MHIGRVGVADAWRLLHRGGGRGDRRDSIWLARSSTDGMDFGSGTISCRCEVSMTRLLDAGQRGLQALVDREDAQLGPLLERQVLEGEAAEQVVHDRAGEADVGVVGHAGRLEAHVGERLDEGPQRHAVLQAVADRHGEGVHDPGQRRALLGHPDEELARPAVVVLADRDEALAVGHPELERARSAGAGQLLPHRLGHDPLDDALDDLRRRSGRAGRRCQRAVARRHGVSPFLAVDSGWATLQLSR